MKAEILHGDCRELLKGIPDNSIDSLATDPPYEYEFMNQRWDGTGVAFEVALWKEVYRVLKPGAFGAVFGADRRIHRVMCALEDAGFLIRHQGAWVSAQVFPKSLDASKAIAKRAGGVGRAKEAVAFMRAKRDELGLTRVQLDERIFGRSDGNVRNWEEGISVPQAGLWPKIVAALGLAETEFDEDMGRGDVEVGREDGSFGYQAPDGERWTKERVLREPITAAALRWKGWGTALKTLEPWVLIRKPMEGTLAENLVKYGVGALNIDGCRLPTVSASDRAKYEGNASGDRGHDQDRGRGLDGFAMTAGSASEIGRWPSVLICSDLDLEGPVGGVEVFGAEDDDLDGVLGPYTKHFRIGDQRITAVDDELLNGLIPSLVVCPKVGPAERELGCDTLPEQWVDPSRAEDGAGRNNPRAGAGRKSKRRNIHPTVKPISLMRHIVRLITPAGGTVLDTFTGSAAGGMAAVWEGMNYLGMELTDTDEQPFLRIGRARLEYALKTPPPPIEARVVKPPPPAPPPKQLELF